MYTFVKYLVRLGLLIFCRKIIFNNRSILNKKGPLLLACNHPNSFFDALLLGAYFKHPVHFLARGDAFKNPFAKKILTALKAIPIYRLREGKEYLALNDYTFERCLQILKEGGIILIFSEGLCVNQWQLRPLKKGTARIALNAWKIPEIENEFNVLPVSFNYSSFTRFRKKVIINFSKPLLRKDIVFDKNEGEQIVALNKLLYNRLEEHLLIEKTNVDVIKFLITNANSLNKRKGDLIEALQKLQSNLIDKGFTNSVSLFDGTKKIIVNRASVLPKILLAVILIIPSLIGLIIHLPIYIPLNSTIKNKTKGTVFYHSALFGSLIILYPLYAIIISIIMVVIFKNFLFLFMIVLMPLSAVVYLFWKDVVESIVNYFKASVSKRKELEQLLS